MRYSYKLKRTDEVSDTEFNEIVALHQSTFNIPADIIIKLIKHRHYIIIYRDGNHLVGTVGIEWIVSGNRVAAYTGNIVIDKNYRRTGIMSHSQMLSTIYTFIKYPFKKRYLVGFITTAEAYNWAININPIPSKEHGIPSYLFDFMLTVARELVDEEHIEIRKGIIIIHMLAKVLQVNNIKEIKVTSHTANSGNFFTHITNGNESGEQLLTLSKLTLTNILKLFKLSKKLNTDLKS